MSIKQMARVWELDLGHAQRLVLLALADHAHDDGGGARPSLGLIAWKTGYSLASVNRIVAQLRRTGIIEATHQGGGRTATTYRLWLDRAQTKVPYKPLYLQNELSHFDTPITRDRAALSPVLGEPSVEPSVLLPVVPLSLVVRTKSKSSSNGKGGVEGRGEVAAVVDAFRAIPGIRPSGKDGGVIAGLVGKYGAAAVQRVMDDDGPTIAAADNALMYLASRFKRSAGRAGPPRETMAERAARYAGYAGKAGAE